MKFEKHEFAFIREAFHEPHQGGDLDFIVMKNGEVLIFTQEGIGHYSSFDNWVDGDSPINFLPSDLGRENEPL
jgi:hypothetical protein